MLIVCIERTKKMSKKKSEKKSERVTLEMSREAAAVCENALELFARLKLGQFREITWKIMPDDWKEVNFDRWIRERDFADELLEMAAKHVFGTNNWGQPDVKAKDEEEMRACELYTTLRYTRMWHDYPEEGDTSWNVGFDKPLAQSGDVMPKCEIKEVENTFSKT